MKLTLLLKNIVLKKSYLLLLVFVIHFSCNNKKEFRHQLTTKSQPWTHEIFDDSEDKFTFALFADLTGGERSGVFDVAIAQLNLLRPNFIINVGDLIEGDHKNLGELKNQWDTFDNRVEKAIAPVFYVGGNHDLSDAQMTQVWETRYGATYYHFIYKNVLFLVLNTEDNSIERIKTIKQLRTTAIDIYKSEGLDAFNKTAYALLPERTAGNIGNIQSDYFIDIIKKYPNVKHTFLFLHKPAWKKENEQNFSRIEKALENRPYTVFNGHVQAYGYEKRYNQDYIQLATTGGEQFPTLGRSMDHITMVTVDNSKVDIANVLLNGILDKTGHIPLNGEQLCFEKEKCKTQ